MASICVKRLMSAVAVSNATVNSDSLEISLASVAGVSAIRFVSSAAGSLTVYQQCSLDNRTFYNPKDRTGATISPVVPAGTGLDTGSWIVFDIALAPYIRFSCIEAGTLSTNVTIDFIFQEKA